MYVQIFPQQDEFLDDTVFIPGLAWDGVIHFDPSDPAKSEDEAKSHGIPHLIDQVANEVGDPNVANAVTFVVPVMGEGLPDLYSVSGDVQHNVLKLQVDANLGAKVFGDCCVAHFIGETLPNMIPDHPLLNGDTMTDEVLSDYLTRLATRPDWHDESPVERYGEDAV